MSLRSLASSGVMRVFAHRNFRLWYAGQSISLIGTWMQSVAQSWLVLELTGDPFLIGVVFAAQFLPVLALGLFGGLVADALPKRPTLVATQIAMMTLAFVLFALTITGLVEVWMVIALALLLGLCNAVDMPVRQAFSIEMVGRQDVAAAVALNAAIFNGARIIGPAIAGLVIAAVGVPAAFLVNGLSFSAVIAALLLMRPEELEPAPSVARPRSASEVVEALGEGLGYVRRTPVVLVALVVVGSASTFGMNFIILAPVYARDVLGLGAEGYGFLMAASGVGSLTAALWLAFVGTPRPIRMAAGAILLGVALILLGISGLFAVSITLMAAAGFGAITMLTSGNSTIQVVVPDELRGRVMSVYGTVFIGSSPIGNLVVGALASAAGVGAGFIVGGGVTLVVAVAAAVWLTRSEPGRLAQRSVASAIGRPGRPDTRPAAPRSSQTTDPSSAPSGPPDARVSPVADPGPTTGLAGQEQS
jgi:MFS family permease